MTLRIAAGRRFALRVVGALLTAALTAAQAFAADEGHVTPLFAFDAFGTLGVVHSDESQADFTRSSLRPNGAGASSSWSPKVDSLLAGQVTVTPSSRLSAVVQVVSLQRYDDSFKPSVEWANLKFQATPDLTIRLGRTFLPIFMMTETRRIGFTYDWVRPPVELYDLVPVTINDGGDISYRLAIGAATHTLQLTIGESSARFSGGRLTSGKAITRDQYFLADTFENGSLTLRAMYGHVHLSIASVQPLFDAFRAFGPRGQEIAEAYEVAGSPTQFAGVGAMYDRGTWYATGEWGHFSSKSFIGSRDAWYLGGGRRFGPITPFAYFAHAGPSGDTSDPGLDLSTLPPAMAPLAGVLNGTLNRMLNAAPHQSTTGAGVRWDFLSNVSATAQYEYLDLAKGSAGTLIHLQPGFQPGGHVHVLSFAIDFVL